MNFLKRLMGEPEPPSRPPLSASPYDLDTPLLYVSDADPFTIRDAAEGVQIFGGIGSGKTSGSGAAIARAFLRAGFGGLVCCAKPEECALWEKYAAETGRAGDLVIVRPGSRGEPAPWRFNFLRYELDRSGTGGGQTENVVNLLTTVVEIVQGRTTERGKDPFWENSTKELLRNAVDLLTLAGVPLALDTICELVVTAPQQAPQPQDWRDGKGLCATCFRTLDARAQSTGYDAGELHTLDITARYWLQSFATLNDRTRSSITATFTGIADMLLRGLAWELLGSDTNIIPEVTYRKGAVIVLDVSIQEYREAGRIVQGLWKRLFQEAILRRDAGQHPRPVFLWCDESQNFVSPFDYEYLATARSAKACTVFLTQNVANYHAKLGEGAQAQADALLGLFGTKVFHSQSDHGTNQYAADLIGKHWVRVNSRNTGGSRQNQQQPGGTTYSAGSTDSLQYKIEPAEFTRLRRGGPGNGYLVDAVIFKAGEGFRSTRDNYALATFDQRQ